MRTRLRPRRTSGSGAAWARYSLGRVLQITGLLVGLIAATAYFGTPSTVAMLRTMLAGVVLFLAGWALARRDPRG